MEKEKEPIDKLKYLEIYQRLADFTKDGIFSYTFNQGKILFANQAFVEILGLDSTPEDITGKKIEEVIEYTREPGLIRKKLQEEGQIYNFEYTFKTLSGQDKWVLHGSLLREEGSRKIVEAVVKDITAQKQMEKTLLFNRFVLNHMSNPVLWIASSGKIDYVNQAAIDVLGYRKEELSGLKIFDIDTNFFQQDWQESWEKIEEEMTAVFETIYKTKDGKVFPVEITANYMKCNDSRHICVVVRNLTERQRVENALRRSEEEKSLILDSLSEFVAYYDSSLNLLWVNRAVSEVVKEPASKLIGLSWEQVWRKLKVRTGVHPVKSVLQTGKFHKKEVTSEDGKSWLIRAYPVKSIEDKIAGIVEVALDISQRKSAEHQRQLNLIRTRRILEETVGALAATSERRDPYTAGHQRRVSQLACAIAKELGFSRNRYEGIRMAANIHDVGKVYVPAEILSKPTTLTKLEFSIIQTHPQIGYDILKEIEFPWPIAKIVLQHHEKLDGSGYPNGITDANILIEAKILTVADVVEAMASHRPYRPALGVGAALGEIDQGRDCVYDLEIVEVCTKLFNRKKFRFE